jgi:hypothetical protein
VKREVKPELLDSLPVDDPGAIGSRRDLQRLHIWMRHRALMDSALRSALNGDVPRHFAELGAGDGKFMLHVARRIAPRWPGLSLTVVDQQHLVTTQTRKAFAQLGWRIECVQADVFDWIRSERNPPCSVDTIVANLFLHHFDDDRLAELCRGIAQITKTFIALEPRRSSFALAFSQQIWAIGCNHVSRHDAPVSVRAGFAGQELSRLWPADGNWTFEERPAGLFSHLFIARRHQ